MEDRIPISTDHHHSRSIETLSSNTLFHFTGKIEYLENILDVGLAPRYSLEDLSMFKWHRMETNSNPKVAIPMVCFCDIPLSKVKDHLSWYGNYGIGIDKKWGIDQGICPILYVDPLSATTEAIINALNGYTKIWLEGLKAEKEYPELMKVIDSGIINSIERFMNFTKPYIGPFSHNGRNDEAKIFYDEREWRFVPELHQIQLRNILIEGEPNFENLKNESNFKITQHKNLCIPITPINIKYIIVENEDDILPIMTKLESKFKSQNYNETSLKKLMASIITTKQIREDF